jgi:hypothetical protein
MHSGRSGLRATQAIGYSPPAFATMLAAVRPKFAVWAGKLSSEFYRDGVPYACLAWAVDVSSMQSSDV